MLKTLENLKHSFCRTDIKQNYIHPQINLNDNISWNRLDSMEMFFEKSMDLEIFWGKTRQNMMWLKLWKDNGSVRMKRRLSQRTSR